MDRSLSYFGYCFSLVLLGSNRELPRRLVLSFSLGEPGYDGFPISTFFLGFCHSGTRLVALEKSWSFYAYRMCAFLSLVFSKSEFSSALAIDSLADHQFRLALLCRSTSAQAMGISFDYWCSTAHHTCNLSTSSHQGRKTTQYF